MFTSQVIVVSHGNRFGDGRYLSQNLSLADQYGYGDTSGRRHYIACDLLPSTTTHAFTTCHLLITTCYSLLAPCYSLLAPCYSLLALCYSLLATRYLLLATLIAPCSVLLATCYLLPFPCSLLLATAARRSPLAARSLLLAPCCSPLDACAPHCPGGRHFYVW